MGVSSGPTDRPYPRRCNFDRTSDDGSDASVENSFRTRGRKRSACIGPDGHACKRTRRIVVQRSAASVKECDVTRPMHLRHAGAKSCRLLFDRVRLPRRFVTLPPQAEPCETLSGCAAQHSRKGRSRAAVGLPRLVVHQVEKHFALALMRLGEHILHSLRATHRSCFRDAIVRDGDEGRQNGNVVRHRQSVSTS